MTNILKEVYKFQNVAPRKCPIKDEVPKGVPTEAVPKELRGLLVVWRKRKEIADKAANGNNAERKKWFVLSGEADAVFRIFCLALREEKRFPVHMCVELYRGWQYALHA
jgi:hypothetical protein